MYKKRDLSKRDRIVYLLVRENWEPFYVGKGSQKRPKGHITEAKKEKNTHKLNIIRQLLKSSGHVPTIVLARNLTSAEASAMEILLIAAIGRKDKGLGPLVNLTDGGEGTSGYNQTPETKAKLKAIHADPTIKAQLSATLRNAFANPEVKARHQAAIAASKDKRSAASKKMFENPITKAKHLAALADPIVKERQRNAMADPEFKARHRAATLAAQASDEYKIRHAEATKLALADPDTRARLITSRTSDEYREKQRIAALAAWAKRKSNQTSIENGALST